MFCRVTLDALEYVPVAYTFDPGSVVIATPCAHEMRVKAETVPEESHLTMKASCVPTATCKTGVPTDAVASRFRSVVVVVLFE